MSEDGFFTRLTRGVKKFFKGAIQSLPTSLAVSGASIGISAALGEWVNPDMDFLSIRGRDAMGIGARLLGATVAGMGINGAIPLFTNSASTPQPETTAPASGRSSARTPERGVAMDITPPFTPQNARESRART